MDHIQISPIISLVFYSKRKKMWFRFLYSIYLSYLFTFSPSGTFLSHFLSTMTFTFFPFLLAQAIYFIECPSFYIYLFSHYIQVMHFWQEYLRNVIVYLWASHRRQVMSIPLQVALAWLRWCVSHFSTAVTIFSLCH